MSALIYEMHRDELNDAASMRQAMIYEVDGKDLDGTDPAWRERFVAFFSAHQQAGSGEVFGAKDMGRLIGTSAVYIPKSHLSEIHRRRWAYITSVYITPEYRRKGFGKILTQRAVDWARHRGCFAVRLRSSEMGRPLYKDVGFAPSDELEIRLVNITQNSDQE